VLNWRRGDGVGTGQDRARSPHQSGATTAIAGGLRPQQVRPATTNAQWGGLVMEQKQLTVHWHRGNRISLCDVEHGTRVPRANSRPVASTLHAAPVPTAGRPVHDGAIAGSRSRLGDAAKAVAAGGCLVLAAACFLLLCTGRRARAERTN
jgi:hypothetical protein